MKKLILVRHVLTEDNELAKLSGHIDSKVSEEGKKQIEKITEFLKYEKIDRIYTTTSSRTKETVKNLANINSIEIQQSEDLQEISFGDFEGKDFKEIQKNYPDEFNKMIEQGYKYTYPLTAIPGMAIVQASSLLNYIIGMAIAFAVAFMLSLTLKYKTDAE